VYDIGVISLCFVHENQEADYKELEDIALRFAGQEGLSDFFIQYLNTLGEIIKPPHQELRRGPGFL